jgi:hypothetical protein
MTTQTMAHPTELYGLADKIQQCRAQLKEAQQAVISDKERRKGSWMARVADFFSTTPPEKAQKQAEEKLTATHEAAQDHAYAWIFVQARDALLADPAVAQQREQQIDAMAKASDEKNQADAWYNQAQGTQQKFIRAADACSSASSSEMLDMVSSKKAFSVLSSMDTSSAASAIQEAKSALRRLSDTLPSKTDHVDIAIPDDTLDLIFDFSFDLGFDFMSMVNMNNLDTAASNCRKQAEHLHPLVDRLKAVASDAEAKYQGELSALQQIEAPYLVAATALVPEIIDVEVPTGLII